MKSVFLLVTDYGYDGMSIEAAFSTEEKARTALRLYGRMTEVEEWTLDEDVGIPDGMAVFYVSPVEADGRCGRAVLVPICDVNKERIEVARKLYSPKHERDRWAMRVIAKDEDHAKEVVAQKAAEMVESGEWFS